MFDRRAYHRAYYAKNRDKLLAKARARRKARWKQHKEWEAAYLARTKERRYAHNRKWGAEHPEVRSNIDHRRRARKAGRLAGNVNFRKLWVQFSGNCPLCAQKLHIGVQKYHYDHIVPLAQGGHHVQGNIQITHARCNIHKGAKLLKAG